MKRVLSISLLLLFVAACSQPVRQTTHENKNPKLVARIERINQIVSWSFSGRIGVKHQNDGGSFRVKWSKASDGHFRAEFVAPMGQGWLKVSGNDESVAIETSENQRVEGKTIEAVAEKVTGWQLPLGSLQYWLFGVPVSGQDYRAQVDASGRIKQLKQAGWVIEYAQYGMQDGYQVPAKLKATSDQFEIKAVIKSWTISAQ